MKVKVKKNHKSDAIFPLEAKKDDIVIGEDKPTHWEGWIYCENKVGINGWVPRAYVNKIPERSNYYKLNRDYNAYELPVLKGELVEIEETESGWALVISETGEKGWIPLENLDLD